MAERRKRPPSAPPAPAPRALTDAESAEVAAYVARRASRPPPPRFQTAAGKDAVSPADGTAPALFLARLARIVGARDESAATLLASQAATAFDGGDLAERCNRASALLAGIAPRDETEGMLAVQMVAAHNLALTMARRAQATERVDFLATYANLSAKLMNAYTRQLGMLARLRGQTEQQTVRVEHVTVQAGGQAVVGDVAPRRKDSEKS